jgi:hypothetical protein
MPKREGNAAKRRFISARSASQTGILQEGEGPRAFQTTHFLKRTRNEKEKQVEGFQPKGYAAFLIYALSDHASRQQSVVRTQHKKTGKCTVG